MKLKDCRNCFCPNKNIYKTTVVANHHSQNPGRKEQVKTFPTHPMCSLGPESHLTKPVRDGRGIVSITQEKNFQNFLGTWKEYSNQCSHWN